MAGDATPIKLNLPTKYTSSAGSSAAERAAPPPIDWLKGTWTVTHSTLSMWRTARNVRISYTPLSPKEDGTPRIDDLVEYEPTGKTGVTKSVEGVDTLSPDGGWDWRGKGMLFFVTSHWELLGWGETTLPDGSVERWAVTWFANTLFTKEGLDIYSDRKEGLSEDAYKRIDGALREIGAQPLIDMVAADMKPVEIKLPWATQK
ncbi:hypothetical protein K4F52_000476 [Lecanicillium sp. MT-2017a]|nr:hypothetical protein K4F52_000476 [Lecanicillium sp. MT-2017a]